MGDRSGLFRDICELAPDLIQCVSADGQVEYVNPAWCAALGYSFEEAAGLHCLEVVDPAERDRFERELGLVFAGERRSRLQSRFVTREGKRFPVEGSVTRRETSGGVSACAIFRDITARRRAQAQVDRLFNLSLDMLSIASGDGFFKRVNPAFERTLGYSREELMSRSFLEFVHPDDQEITREAMQQLLDGEPVVDFRNRYRAKDGSFHWLQWRSTPVDEEGLVYAVARDVTEERQTQELISRQAAELARSNEDLEEFAYAASHDLQAPLRAIDHLVGFISADLPDPQPQVAEHLQRLRTRVRQMQELVEDLLTYSRAGKAAGEIREIDLTELVQEITRLISVPSGFEVKLIGKPRRLRTAVTPLEQVLRNLIANALKHHDRSEGEVRVSARRTDNMWEFAVADDGPGIPAEQRDRVFQMFQRLGGVEATGSGIGLALVKKVVERFGGRVWITADGDRGTTVRFTWPETILGAEAE